MLSFSAAPSQFKPCRAASLLQASHSAGAIRLPHKLGSSWKKCRRSSVLADPGAESPGRKETESNLLPVCNLLASQLSLHTVRRLGFALG